LVVVVVLRDSIFFCMQR